MKEFHWNFRAHLFVEVELSGVLMVTRNVAKTNLQGLRRRFDRFPAAPSGTVEAGSGVGVSSRPL